MLFYLYKNSCYINHDYGGMLFIFTKIVVKLTRNMVHTVLLLPYALLN